MKKKKRFPIFFNRFCFIIFGFYLVLFATISQAQGFTTLKDKYGTASSTSVQTKEPGPGPAQDGQTASAEGAVPEGMVMLNGVDVDIKDMVKLISNVTGKNFLLGEQLRGTVTIISEKPMTYDMAYQAFLSTLEVNGYTTTMTPAGLISIVKKKDSLAKPKDLYTDASPVTDKFITRILQLENISSKEISQILKPMVSKDGEIIPYPTTNSLIITDTGSNIDHILKLVRELDQEGPQEILEIIPIINADAKDIATKIKDIFEDEEIDPATRRRSRRGATQDLEEVQAISKVIADERTNSVIIMGTKRSIIKVKALIARLDRSISGVEGTIHVYYLKHANAKEMAEVLSNLVADAQKTAGAAKGKKQPEQQTTGAVELEGGVKVTADEGTNSLIITAAPKDFTTLVEKVIQKLDIVRPQIYLEAVIMSLDVNKESKWGMFGNAGFNSIIGGNTLSTFGSLLPTTGSVISSIAGVSGSGGAAGGFMGGVMSSNTIDVTLQDGSTVSVPAISTVIQALQSNTDVNILSTPSIMTLDNEEATIQVGQTIPVPSGTAVSSGGGLTTAVTREDIGIILKITPQISESDNVRLNIAQEISSVFSTDPTFGPTLDKKSVTTTVLAKNMQTIVIGGLIDDKTEMTTHKIPLLGDIPLLGYLFKNRIAKRDKTNLLVFITPYIVRERADSLAILKKKIEERNAFIDQNFGVGQRKEIRRAIKNHASDLLEFKCEVTDMGNPCLTEPRDPTKSAAVRRYEESQKAEGKKN